MAGTIDNLVANFLPPGFGEGSIGPGETAAGYIAQTFIPLGDRMQSLDFFVEAIGPADTKYHVLITTVQFSPDGEFQPGTVLKEISGLVEPFDAVPGPTMVHINLKGLELTEGVPYAIILDTVVARDGEDDLAGIGFNLPGGYAPGTAALLMGGVGRAADFASDWFELDGADGAVVADLAFKAVFSDAGETINGNKKDNKKLKGTDDDDTIIGKAGKDKLKGLDGFDLLNGGKHDDKLIGGNDGDQLIGGKGNDILKGGPGEDCYYFDFKMTKKSAKANYDTIKDFSTTEDAIYLKQSRFDLPLGEYDGAANGLSYKNGKLKYEGKMLAEFKGNQPASLDDIDIVVYA